MRRQVIAAATDHAACPPVAPQRAVFHICAVNHEPCSYLPPMRTQLELQQVAGR